MSDDDADEMGELIPHAGGKAASFAIQVVRKALEDGYPPVEELIPRNPGPQRGLGRIIFESREYATYREKAVSAVLDFAVRAPTMTQAGLDLEMRRVMDGLRENGEKVREILMRMRERPMSDEERTTPPDDLGLPEDPS